MGIGKKVKIVLNPELSTRNKTFRFLKGKIAQIVDAVNTEDNSAVHQYGVTLKEFPHKVFFYPSELEEI